MVAQSCDFPVNIDTTVKAENCNMYCDYKYEYNDSSCVVKNMGTMLKIKYDLKSDGTVAQAFLNKRGFNVSELQVFQPSRNTYKGIRADIELVIKHTGKNNQELLISIPFVTSVGSSSSSSLKSGGLILDNIINEFTKQTAASTPSDQAYQININKEVKNRICNSNNNKTTYCFILFFIMVYSSSFFLC